MVISHTEAATNDIDTVKNFAGMVHQQQRLSYKDPRKVGKLRKGEDLQLQG